MLSKKGYILISLLFSLMTHGLSQHLSLYDINSSSYPALKANFYAFDENGIQNVKLTRSEVVIEENLNPQEVTRVTNPEYAAPEALSVVLSVDISGSMIGNNMEIAKQAAGTLLRIIQLDRSECAITSFDHMNYINSDFSNDPVRLSRAIDAFKAQGGTNYDEAFNNELTGALEIAKSGVNKKVIIFMTDGLGIADKDLIIQKANSIGVRIYCVTVDMFAPTVLKEISTRTGGSFFENVNTIEQAKRVYQKILFEVQELEPSTVEWISSPDCESLKSISFKAPVINLEDNSAGYIIGENLLSKLIPGSSNIKFKNVLSDRNIDTTITLRAINRDFTLLSATSSHKAFNIIDTSFPLKISSGQDFPITIQYTSEVRNYEEAKISINTDLCDPVIIYANNGLNEEVDVPLKVEHPNGGEVFFVGSDTAIQWSGVFPSEEIKLEFSSNAGISWNVISDGAKALQSDWQVPNTIGDQMLIRGSVKFDTKKSDLEELYGRRDKLNGFYYTMSPDNSKLIRQNRSTTIIHDLMTGDIIDTIDYVRYIEDPRDQFPPFTLAFFNGDGSKIYTYRYGQPLQIYSMQNYERIGELPQIAEGAYFNDEATQYMRQKDHTVQIVDIETGEVLKEMMLPSEDRIMVLASSYRDNFVVISKPREKICEVWNIDTESQIASFNTTMERMNSGIISADKKFLITTSYSTTNGHYPHHAMFSVFDIEKKRELYSWTNPDIRTAILDIAGGFMLRTENDVHQVVEIATGEIITVVPHSGKAGALSRNGKFVMIHSHSNQIDMKMFRFDPNSYGGGMGSDVSDNTFSIVAPKLAATTIDFGLVRLGDLKELVFAPFLKNPQNVEVRVDSIYLEGGDAEAFSIVSNQSSFKIKGQTETSIELRFKPIRIGTNETSIVVQTHFERILVPLKGEGMDKRISLTDRTINLGKVEIGNSKDSLVSAVITNTGSSTISISSVKIAGPDFGQFALTSNKGLKLKSNSSADLQIAFSPALPGKTSTLIRYEVDGTTSVNQLLVFAEGVGQKELISEETILADNTELQFPDSLRIFKARVLDMDTRKPLPSTLTYQESTQQNNGGVYEFYTTFDSQIKVIAASKGYLPEAFVLGPDPGRKIKEVDHDFLLTMVVAGKFVELDNVLFVQSKPQLLPESYEELDMLHRYMIDHPDIRIELAGHTDNQGNSKMNQQLSEDRVKAIRNYLIEKGINKNRISGKGYGDTHPVASNEKEETRRLNRRFEFKIIE